MKTEQIDWFTLSAYFEGTLAPEERATVERWLGRDPAHTAEAEAMRALWNARRHREPQDWGTERSRVTQALPSMLQREPASPERGRRWIQQRVRAVLTLAATAAIVVWAWRGDVFGTNDSALTVVSTASGELTRFTLPDGSSMLLAPESRLRYAEGFGKSHRTVELDGQALFTVTHAAGTPFVVTTAGTSTRVLGTSFTVRQYADDSAPRVLVAEGRVSVAAAGDTEAPEIVSSGEEVIISAEGSVERRRVQDLAAALAWTDGRIEFIDMPLRDVVRDVSRTYGMPIRIAAPELQHQRITGTIARLDPDSAIALLTQILGAHAVRSGDTILITE